MHLMIFLLYYILCVNVASTHCGVSVAVFLRRGAADCPRPWVPRHQAAAHLATKCSVHVLSRGGRREVSSGADCWREREVGEQRPGTRWSCTYTCGTLENCDFQLYKRFHQTLRALLSPFKGSDVATCNSYHQSPHESFLPTLKLFFFSQILPSINIWHLFGLISRISGLLCGFSFRFSFRFTYHRGMEGWVISGLLSESVSHNWCIPEWWWFMLHLLHQWVRNYSLLWLNTRKPS